MGNVSVRYSALSPLSLFCVLLSIVLITLELLGHINIGWFFATLPMLFGLYVWAFLMLLSAIVFIGAKSVQLTIGYLERRRAKK